MRDHAAAAAAYFAAARRAMPCRRYATMLDYVTRALHMMLSAIDAAFDFPLAMPCHDATPTRLPVAAAMRSAGVYACKTHALFYHYVLLLFCLLSADVCFRCAPP